MSGDGLVQCNPAVSQIAEELTKNFTVPGMEPRTLHIEAKYSITELPSRSDKAVQPRVCRLTVLSRKKSPPCRKFTVTLEPTFLIGKKNEVVRNVKKTVSAGVGRCHRNFWQVSAGVTEVLGRCRQVSLDVRAGVITKSGPHASEQGTKSNLPHKWAQWTLALWGIPYASERGTKSEVAHRWAQVDPVAT